jgi:hypothetical protein
LAQANFSVFSPKKVMAELGEKNKTNGISRTESKVREVNRNVNCQGFRLIESDLCMSVG